MSQKHICTTVKKQGLYYITSPNQQQHTDIYAHINKPTCEWLSQLNFRCSFCATSAK